MDVKPLYIYPNKTRMRLFFFSGFVFIGISAALIYFGIYFWAYALFFLGLFNLLFNFKKAFLNSPLLIVDKEGVTDNMNFPSMGIIKWEDIKEVKKETIMGFDNIMVYLKDPEGMIEKQFFIKRYFMNYNLENLGTWIMFRCNVFPEQADKVATLMNRLAKGEDEG